MAKKVTTPAKKVAPVKEKRNVMSKKDIVESVAELNDITKTLSAEIVDAVFTTITDAMLEDNDVQIHGFGKFSVKDTPARMAHNPKTKEKIEVAASRKVAFKPALSLKNQIKGE